MDSLSPSSPGSVHVSGSRPSLPSPSGPGLMESGKPVMTSKTTKEDPHRLEVTFWGSLTVLVLLETAERDPCHVSCPPSFGPSGSRHHQIPSLWPLNPWFTPVISISLHTPRCSPNPVPWRPWTTSSPTPSLCPRKLRRHLRHSGIPWLRTSSVVSSPFEGLKHLHLESTCRTTGPVHT